MSATDTPTEHTTGIAGDAPVQTVAPGGVVDARIVTIAPEAAEELRRHVEEASGGGNRFVWFLIGFVAALFAGVVASVAFLAVSDDDDDGNLDLDVPAVEVDVDG